MSFKRVIIKIIVFPFILLGVILFTPIIIATEVKSLYNRIFED